MDLDSPTVENTAVFRMKEEFNKFLHAGSTASKKTEGKRLKFSDSMMDSSDVFGTSMLYRSHAGESTISSKELKGNGPTLLFTLIHSFRRIDSGVWFNTILFCILITRGRGRG